MNLPEFLIDKLKLQYGQELTEEIINGYSKKRVTTFRVNTLNSNSEEIENVLKELNIEYENVKWRTNL